MGAILFKAEASRLLSTRLCVGVKRDRVVPKTNVSTDTHSKLSLKELAFIDSLYLKNYDGFLKLHELVGRLSLANYF